MRKLHDVFTFASRRMMDPVFILPTVQMTPELARTLDTALYYLFIMALGVISVAYWVILEFTKGLSTLYKILLVLIIGVSGMMCVWGLFDARFVNLMLPIWVSLIALSAFSRGLRLYKGQNPEEVSMNRRTWLAVLTILVCVVVVAAGAGVNSFLRGGPDTLHYLMQSQRRQEKSIQQQAVAIQHNTEKTTEVDMKQDSLILGLNQALYNQTLMITELAKVNEENGRLKRALAATQRTVKSTERTVNTVQQRQEETREKVQAVEMKVDTVKAVVEQVIPLDTVKPVPAVTPPSVDTVKKKRKWWPFGRD